MDNNFFKLFSIFGKPVSHSKSPLIHNAVFQKYLPNYLYCRTEIENGENLRKVFFDLKLSGASVTVPYKEVAFQICDEVRGVAKQIGAVNCLHLENGKLIGYNTDVYGFLDSIEEWQKDINSVLIIGAGGTSKALTYGFLEKKYQVTILNRSEKRLKAFENLDVNLFTWDNFKPENYDLIVNVTSAGLDLKLPDEVNLPAPKEILENLFSNPKTKYAVDVIYHKTPFLKLAEKYNLKTKDGSLMLVYQGVLANQIFTNFKIPKEYIAKEMLKIFQ
jgi:shikimate dehydrogenase